MQEWLDRLTDLAALRGDQHMLKEALQDFAERTGFGGYAYLSMQPGHCVAVSNYHSDWQAEYFRRNFKKIDPVIRRALTFKRAFSWSAEGERPRLSKKERSFYALAADFKIRSGITIPVRSAFGGFATFTLASEKTVIDLKREIDPVAAAEAAAQLHARIQFADASPSAEESRRLDPKAALYLNWTAAGKKQGEIADIEGVDYDSVRVKLRDTRKDFDARTIAQMTAVAIRKRLI